MYIFIINAFKTNQMRKFMIAEQQYNGQLNYCLKCFYTLNEAI